MSNSNFVVVGVDNDGCLLCQPEQGPVYNCGETLEEFGPENLTPEEAKVIITD